MGVDCPTFTNFDEMLDKAKPDVVMVTTKDSYPQPVHRAERSTAGST